MIIFIRLLAAFFHSRFVFRSCHLVSYSFSVNGDNNLFNFGREWCKGDRGEREFFFPVSIAFANKL